MGTAHQEGFTLVEVVVAAVLLALLMAGLYQATVFGLSMWDRGERQIDEQQNVRLAANHIARELRTAYSFDIGAEGVSQEPSDSLSMVIPGKNQTPENCRYYFDGGNEIQRRIRGGGNNIVAYGIKRLKFSSPEENMVVIEVEGRGGYSLKTQVLVRMFDDYLLPPPEETALPGG